MKILILIMLLTGCSGSVVTLKNAKEVDHFYDFNCRILRTDGIEPTVIIDKEVAKKVCSGKVECYDSISETIYMQNKDWKALGHGKLHHYCKVGEHMRIKKGPRPPGSI